jgi:hypothetical protein
MAKSRSLVAGLVFSLLLGGSGLLVAQESVPADDLIIELLSMESERIPSDYRVAIVLPGEMRGRAGFITKKMAKVTYIGPVFDQGRKRRGVGDKVFYWNTVYGWFHYAVEEDRRGALVHIWSERKGEVEIR